MTLLNLPLRVRGASALLTTCVFAFTLVGCGSDDDDIQSPAVPDDVVSLAWTPFDVGTEENVTGVDFPNHGPVGYLVGRGGTALKTLDGGQTWAAFNWSTGRPFSANFLDENTGIVNEGGTIGWTSDGGDTWTIWQSPDDETYTWSGAVASPTNAVILAGGTKSIVTTDAGQTWSFREELGTNMLDADFANASVGLAVGDGGDVNRTEDGGVTWAVVGELPDRGQSVSMVTESMAFAAGNNGMIARTTDGGATWTALDSGTDQMLGAIDFVDSSLGMAAGGSALLRTVDGGETWVAQDIGTATGLMRVSQSGRDTAIAVGIGGVALRGVVESSQ